MKKRKRWKKEKEKSLESTVASGMTGGGLSAQEGSLLRSCMFGSIQYVHVVNMKAGILYAQQKQIQRRNRRACFLFSLMILMVHSWFTRKQDKDTNRKANVILALIQTQSYIVQKKYTSRKQKRQKEWLHICTRIQRRNTASNRGDKTTCFKVVSLPAERLLNTFWQGDKWSTELWMVSLFKSQRLFQKKQTKEKHKRVVWTVLWNCLCTAETARCFRCSCA